MQDDMRDLSSMREAVMNMTTPQFLNTMKIRLLRGRFLNEGDRADSSKVAVVDENLANQVFPGQDPIGQRIKFGENEKPMILEVVGVVSHVKQYGLDEANPVQMQFYVPLSQSHPLYISDALRHVTFVVRSSNASESISKSIRARLAQVDPTQPLFEMKTYQEVVSEQTEVKRFTASLLTAFAAIALFLACLGIYGVLSYSVEQRVREIGIRMAMGAALKDVIHIVLGQAIATVTVGMCVGILGALMLTRYMSSVLFGVEAWDPFVFAGVALLLAFVALLASFVPARRAAKVDPIVALRYE
jgi:putative ABC transport system permease protein